MRRGQHAADDGSFGRSAGGAMARGLALIVVAVLLGVILLNATDSPEPFASVNTDNNGDDDSSNPTTTVADDTSTTVTTAVAAHNPAEVTVLVANGASISGLASKIADQLKPLNYVVAEPTNTKEPASESAVFYAPGYEADAAAIAAQLGPPPKTAPMPEPPPVDDLAGAQVLVVAAADLSAASG